MKQLNHQIDIKENIHCVYIGKDAVEKMHFKNAIKYLNIIFKKIIDLKKKTKDVFKNILKKRIEQYNFVLNEIKELYQNKFIILN